MRADPSGKRLLLAALAGSCLLVAVLAFQHRGLEADNGRLTRRLTTLPVGSYVPTVRAPASDGDSATVAEPGRTEILLYLTTTCEYCLASIPEWRRVIKHAAEQGVPVVAVSMDSAAATASYLASHGLASVPYVLFGDARLRFLYRSSSVPQTLLIDTGGRVVYSRPELFTAVAADSLIELLNQMAALRAAAMRK